MLAIGAVLAVLSFLLNLGISALNYAKIKATEHVIYATGLCLMGTPRVDRVTT